MAKDYTNTFKGEKVLITGGLGFIGSNLASRLVDLGAHVLIVDSLIPEYGGNLFNIRDFKDQVYVNISDVRDEHALKYLVKDQSYLFNLAGQTSHLDSMQDPYTDIEINAIAQLHILEACRKFNPDLKILFASTRQIYGRPRYLPVDEEHPVDPVDVNGVNKLAGERFHLSLPRRLRHPLLHPASHQYDRTMHAGERRPPDLPGHLDPDAAGREAVRGVGRPPVARLHLRGRRRRSLPLPSPLTVTPTAASSTWEATPPSAVARPGRPAAQTARLR